VDDESSQCGSASLWEVMNMVSVIASNQQQIKNEVRDGIGGVRERIASQCEKTNETTLVNEIRDVKRVLESGNETRLEDVVTEMKGEIRDEIRDVKRVLESGNETRLENVVTEMKGEIRDEIRDVGKTVASGCEVEIRKMRDEIKNESDRVRAAIEDVKRLIESSNHQRVSALISMFLLLASQH